MKIKSGDLVECVPGFTTDEGSGGKGYRVGRRFIVNHVVDLGGDNNEIAWEFGLIGTELPRYRYSGVYFRALRKVKSIKPEHNLKKHTI